MINIPIEPEDSLIRLNGNKEFKRRNRNFGTYKEVKELFPTNESILKKIFEVRYAKTLGGCPQCQRPFATFKKVSDKLAYRCKCNFKIYPLKGTHLEQSRTPLVEIVDLIYQMFRNKHGVPATALERETRRDYETCLYNLHRASDWMGWSLECLNFTPGSTIEIDEVYPKAQTGLGIYYSFKSGAGSERTHGVLVMTERDNPENGFKGITKAFCFDKSDYSAVEKLIKKYIRPESNHNIYTDEHNYYKFLRYSGYLHSTVKHKAGQYKDGDCSTNTSEGYNERVKTTVHRVYLGVYPQYLQLYVDRVAFNHTNKAKTFFEALDCLFNSLPDLNSCVKKRVQRKKRNRKKKATYRPAA